VSDLARAKVPPRRSVSARPETSDRATGKAEAADFAAELGNDAVPAAGEGARSTRQQRPSPEMPQARTSSSEDARLPTPRTPATLRTDAVPAAGDAEQSTPQQRPSPETRPASPPSGEDARLPAPRMPAPSRGPADAGTRLPRPIQPANGGRPQAAPPRVHIGTLDIRIEAPKQRPQSPPRQPVTFRGSGILSRLYLRRV